MKIFGFRVPGLEIKPRRIIDDGSRRQLVIKNCSRKSPQVSISLCSLPQDPVHSKTCKIRHLNMTQLQLRPSTGIWLWFCYVCTDIPCLFMVIKRATKSLTENIKMLQNLS